MEAGSSSRDRRRDDMFPCVIGDKYPEFCNKKFPTIEKHNEHIRRVHTSTFWCEACLHRFNVSLPMESFHLAKQDHEQDCPGKSSEANRELRSKTFIMTQEQLGRFESREWEQTGIPDLNLGHVRVESAPEICWMRIRETIFPGSETRILRKKDFLTVQSPIFDIGSHRDTQIVSDLPQPEHLQNDSDYQSTKSDAKEFQLPDISEEDFYWRFASDRSGEQISGNPYDRLFRKRSPGARGKWSEEETDHLRLGVSRDGVRKRARIPRPTDTEFTFKGRTVADLNDRFRTFPPYDYDTMMKEMDEEAEPGIRNSPADHVTMTDFPDSDISIHDTEGWKKDLPEKLYNDLSSIDPASDLVGKLSDIVSPLLRSFALRLGSIGPSEAEMEAMLLIFERKYTFSAVFNKVIKESPLNKRVRDELLSMDLNLLSNIILPSSNISPDESSATEAILKWIESTEREGIPPIAQSDTTDLGHAKEQPSIIDNRNRVFDSVAYTWLAVRLSRKLSMKVVGMNSDVPSLIHQEVINCFKHLGRSFKEHLPDQYRMTFTTGWNPTEFLYEQFGSQCDTSRLLGDILTLTGTATDAEILPCWSYLCHTWPTTGPTFLKLLGDALKSVKAVSGELEDKTYVKCDFTRSGLEVEVRGFTETIAIIGEQIGWLGAAVRPSCSDSGFSSCQPIFKISPGGVYDSKCCFEFPTIPMNLTEDTPGQCWHEMFRNPVIVGGYPIPRRKRYGSGLEMPLNVMAGLNSSPRIHKYGGSFYLKGYSTALVPTEKIDNMVLWHLYYSDDGSRLPYPNPTGLHCPDLRMQDLTAARHVVGWCSTAKFMTGAADMNYVIGASQLQRPGKEFALEKISFSFGQFITGGCQFAIGRKDQHVRATKGTYIDKLRWLDKKYVTLWDVDEERGWLVDGNAALLHLLRSSLQYSSTDKFSLFFHFQPQDFQESKNPYTLDSALEVLRNSKNQQLELYDRDTDIEQGCVVTSRTTVKDRVEEFYEILEKLFDHTMTSEASSKGLNAKSRFQDHLEGWDFRDIATNRDPFFTKKATLGLSMLGWPDLTRAISAITLFGKGFGDLIEATGTQGGVECKEWLTVPKNRNLLCVSSGHLKDIISDEGGNLDTNPITVVPGLLWKVPSSINPFDISCQCATRELSSRKHHAVQSLISMKLWSGRSQSCVKLDDHARGAVIFGPLIDWKRGWGSFTGISRSLSQSSSLSALGGSTSSPQTNSSDLASSSSSFPASSPGEPEGEGISGTSTIGPEAFPPMSGSTAEPLSPSDEVSGMGELRRFGNWFPSKRARRH